MDPDRFPSTPARPPAERGVSVRRAVLFVITYVIAAWIGARFATVDHAVSPIWPPSGISVAGLLVLGLGYWPAVAVGATLGAVLTGLPWIGVPAVAAANTFEAAASAWLIRRLAGPGGRLDTLSALPGFGVGVIAPPAAAASMGTAVLLLGGFIPPGEVTTAWLTWWFGDALGILILVPLLLQWRTGYRPQWSWPAFAEAVLLALALTAACVVVFFHPGNPRVASLPYFVFPFVTWAGWRFGPRGATVVIVAVGFAALWGTSLGLGAFSPGLSAENVLELSLFLGTMSVTGLMIGAASEDRRRSLRALQASDARQTAILAVIPDAVLRLRRDATVLDARGSSALVQADTALPCPLERLLPAEVAAPLREVMERALATRGLETRIVTLERAETLYLEVRAIPIARNEVVAVLRDLTGIKRAEFERQRLERELLERQKLESLGVLAGGIAHDFNNLLTGILGYASLARSDVPPDSELDDSLRVIESSAARAADLCRQLLAYAGKARMVADRMDLSALVRESTELMRVSLRGTARLELELRDDLPEVVADAAQIRQVLMNLVMNASDAVAASGGVVRVRTGIRQVGDEPLQGLVVPAPPRPGVRYVCLEVSDNGTGIDPAILPRIFDPFFSTRFTGRGLGLAAVLGIVRTHNAVLQVVSAPGRGSSFTLFLEAARELGERAESDAERPWTGTGQVLVIERDAAVRRVLCRMLDDLGFTPIEAADTAAALACLREHGSDIVAAIADVTIVTGDEPGIVDALRAIVRHLPVVTMHAVENGGGRASPPGVAALQKPFDREGLIRSLRLALES